MKALKAEVSRLYGRNMNDLVMQRVLPKLRIQQPALFGDLTIPSDPAAPVPAKGRVPVPAYDYDERLSLVRSGAFTINKGVKVALAKVHLECDKVTAMSLFNINLIKYMVLDEFQLMQTQTYQHVYGFLKNVWVPATKNVVISSLSTFGKGWFNLKETDQHAYDKGKLKRLFRLIKLVMQDALRTLVKQSVFALTDALQRCAEPVLRADTEEWGSDKLYDTHLAPSGVNPLFLITLSVDGEKKDFTFSTPTDTFCATIIRIFDEGIEATSNMLDIEPLIMSHLFWVGTPTLSSVSPQEPWVAELRAGVEESIQRCIKPLQSYLRMYERYRELVNLDVQVYLQEFMADDREATDVKKECEKHMRSREQIGKEIPNSVDIGIFHVSCIELRNKLMAKCQQLSDALLELLCTKLRTQAQEITGEFTKMAQVLYSRPNGIEDLMDQREFMKSVPEAVKSLEGNIRRTLAEWDLLESFNCSLSDSDFALRWDVYGWPKKISEQLHSTKEVLDSDQERFIENLGADQKEFAENIASLQMIVAGFAQHQDIKKTEHVAVEVRKIAKALKESQDMAAKYNNRERLCNLPVTDYEHLHRCVKDFEPFKNLWLTTDEWQKSHKVWMHDNFNELDPEAMETQINSASKAINKCIKAFRDAPGCLKVAETVREWIEEFKPYAPLIQALRNPGMRDRHWNKLSEHLGFNVKPGAGFTFKKVLQLKLDQYMDVITKVCVFVCLLLCVCVRVCVCAYVCVCARIIFRASSLLVFTLELLRCIFFLVFSGW